MVQRSESLFFAVDFIDGEEEPSEEIALSFTNNLVPLETFFDDNQVKYSTSIITLKTVNFWIFNTDSS